MLYKFILIVAACVFSWSMCCPGRINHCALDNSKDSRVKQYAMRGHVFEWFRRDVLRSDSKQTSLTVVSNGFVWVICSQLAELLFLDDCLPNKWTKYWKVEITLISEKCRTWEIGCLGQLFTKICTNHRMLPLTNHIRVFQRTECTNCL